MSRKSLNSHTLAQKLNGNRALFSGSRVGRDADNMRVQEHHAAQHSTSMSVFREKSCIFARKEEIGRALTGNNEALFNGAVCFERKNTGKQTLGGSGASTRSEIARARARARL